MAAIDSKAESVLDHVEKITSQQDAAVDYSGARVEITPEERRLLLKLDLTILPMLWLMYFLNFIDRAAITIARLDKMQKQLHISSTQYQTCVSALFIGYLIAQVPSNMYITRTRPSLFMGFAMVVWAICSTLTAVVHDFKGLFLCRFFLGIAEAPFYPGALYLLSMFYTRKEIATRITILFTGSICGNAFSGLIAIGIFKMEGLCGLAGWRWLFIIEGLVSFCVAIAGAFILPNEPLKTLWLTEQERQLAHRRVTSDTVGKTEDGSVWRGLKDAVLDPKLWVLIVTQHFLLGASGFKNFFPTLVQTLGFDQTITLVLTCPPYLVSGLISVVWAWHSGRKNERTWHFTITACVSAIGFIIAASTMNTGARYFAMFLFAGGIYCCNGLVLGWVASTCGQTKEKKSISLALTNCIANVATIYSPYWWPQSDAPRYEIPLSISAAFVVVAILAIWLLRTMLVRANRKIRQSESETVVLFAY